MGSILDTLLDTIGRSAFMAEHFGQAPLHISGSPDRVADVMNWDELSRLLSMSAVWTPASLQVVLETASRSPRRSTARRRNPRPAPS